jgi:protein-S-isoprenylcysteine O-methyltransferase Ste14
MDRLFAWLALALCALFFAVDVVWRSYVYQRSTGSMRVPGRNAGLKPADLIGGAVAFAGMTATVTGVVLAATERLGPVRHLDFTGARVAGTVLALIGIGMVAAAQSGMGASWRPTVDYTERTELVQTGLFAVIRNPIFTFIIVTFAGVALMAPNVVTLAGVVAIALGIALHVRRVEEPYLRWAHCDSYRDYTARVGRFIPGIGRIRR